MNASTVTETAAYHSTGPRVSSPGLAAPRHTKVKVKVGVKVKVKANVEVKAKVKVEVKVGVRVKVKAKVKVAPNFTPRVPAVACGGVLVVCVLMVGAGGQRVLWLSQPTPLPPALPSTRALQARRPCPLDRCGVACAWNSSFPSARPWLTLGVLFGAASGYSDFPDRPPDQHTKF